MKTKEIESRRLATFYIVTSPDSYNLYTGDEAVKLNQFLKDSIISGNKLKGKSAFPGVRRGVIKIIRGQNDFHKMKKGDILLAPNTRPEYVPVMKLAGAVIADEGGITSHAAIISRELRIPCIVGMQGATYRFKDGDLVEVDANKGVVKKL